jgi:hypothetical protein
MDEHISHDQNVRIYTPSYLSTSPTFSFNGIRTESMSVLGTSKLSTEHSTQYYSHECALQNISVCELLSFSLSSAYDTFK